MGSARKATLIFISEEEIDMEIKISLWENQEANLYNRNFARLQAGCYGQKEQLPGLQPHHMYRKVFTFCEYS